MLARSLIITAAAFATLTTGAIASPAHTVGGDTNSTAIRYHDLDLTGAAGVAALKQRIARAAKNVCWQADGPTLQDHARFDTCHDNAIADASPQTNAVIASVRSDHRYAMANDAIAMLGR